MADIDNALGRLHSFRRHDVVGLAVAVGRKFRADKAGYLATLVAYYAIFSLFPLLLVLISVLGFLLGESSPYRERILSSVLAAQIPVIGDQINRSVTEIRGSGTALALGLVVTLVAGTSVIQALQHGLDEIWEVPDRKRRSVVVARLRGLLFLALLGTGIVASTALAGVGGTRTGILPLGLRGVGLAASLAINFGLFLVAFRFLTAAKITIRDVAPGAALAAVLWGAMQVGGGFAIRAMLPRATALYGVFALVLGLMAWLFVGSNVTLLAAELNAVLKKQRPHQRRLRRRIPRAITGKLKT